MQEELPVSPDEADEVCGSWRVARAAYAECMVRGDGDGDGNWRRWRVLTFSAAGLIWPSPTLLFRLPGEARVATCPTP